PTYPFQRQRHWIEFAPAPQACAAGETLPLLGRRLLTAGRETLFENTLHQAAPRWLVDHQVFGKTVVPGACYFEMLLAAGRALRAEWLEPAGLILQEPMLLEEGIIRTVQTVIEPEQDGVRRAAICSRSDGSGFTTHVAGQLIAAQQFTAQVRLADARARC